MDAPSPRPGATGARGALLPALIVLVIGAVFVGVYLAAFHAPRPHHLPVAVVGSAQQARSVETALDRHAPGGFDVRAYADRSAAREAVQHRDVYGAYDASAGTPVLLDAGANGPSVTAVLQGAFGAVAQHSGKPLTSQDVAPSSSGDTRGLSVFYSAFGLVLAGFLFGTMTYQMAPRLEFRRRMAGLAVFGVAGGLMIAVLADTVFGALPGPFLGVAAVAGLLAAAVGSTTMALVRRLGPAGYSVAAVLLLIFGNATSGGVLPPDFLPGWLYPVSDVLPVGVAVRAVQGMAYFHDQGLWSAVAVLSAWIVVCVAVLYHRDVRSARLHHGVHARVGGAPGPARAAEGGL